MANGTVYRRDDRKKPWVVHVSWLEGDRRRQSKKSYSTKKEAQEALATAIEAHRRQDFVAPTDLRVRDFVDTWLHALETQGRKVTTVTGYRQAMKNWVLPHLGTHKLQELRATDLDKLYAELLHRRRLCLRARRCPLPAVWAAVDFEPPAGCEHPDVFDPFGNRVEIRRPAREST